MDLTLNISKAAIEELKRIATETEQEPKVRVYMQGGGCSGFTVKMDFTHYVPDEEFDTVVELDGVEFIVDAKSALLINGANLDFGGDLLDRGFKWEFPSSTGGCGCGVSFSF